MPALTILSAASFLATSVCAGLCCFGHILYLFDLIIFAFLLIWLVWFLYKLKIWVCFYDHVLLFRSTAEHGRKLLFRHLCLICFFPTKKG